MLRIAFCVLCLIVLTAETTQSPPPMDPPQYRAIWVDAFHPGIKSPMQVEKLIADVRRANLNTVFIQVRKAGDAYFNKSDEPRARDITGPRDFDPLDYVIKLAHSSVPRIQVHAWINTFFVGQSSRIYSQRGDEWGNRTSDGATGGYLDPGVPEVQIYTNRIFVDVARNYDVDGLHMDFVRYPGFDWGYSPLAVQLYMLQSQTSTSPDPADPQWQAWRRTRVTAFVRDLHDDLQNQKPSVKLSGALICFGGIASWTATSAYSSVYQDWRGWLANGFLDFGVPMNYDSEWSGREKNWFGQWLAFEKDTGIANRVLTGVGAFLNYPEDTLAQIRRVLAPSARGNRVLGVAIYSYASTSVYGTDDFWTSPDLASGLPRQPYSGGTTTEAELAQRARAFNQSFMTQLSQPDRYQDVQLGSVATQPVFTLPAPTP